MHPSSAGSPHIQYSHAVQTGQGHLYARPGGMGLR